MLIESNKEGERWIEVDRKIILITIRIILWWLWWCVFSLRSTLPFICLLLKYQHSNGILYQADYFQRIFYKYMDIRTLKTIWNKILYVIVLNLCSTQILIDYNLIKFKYNFIIFYININLIFHCQGSISFSFFNLLLLY